MKLFLDDERYPPQDGEEWVVIRTVSAAIAWVVEKGIPSFVSFDNDLGAGQPEGHCFADWLVELDMDFGSMPHDFGFYVHSQNVAAVARIRAKIDGHLAERAKELAAGRPWPPHRPKEPWGRPD